MSGKEQVQPARLKFWQSIKRLLFEPNPAIREVGSRREATLISIINFLFAFLGLVGSVSIFSIHGFSRNVFVLIGIATLAAISYIFSRTKFHKVGSYLIVWALVFVAFATGDASRLVDSLHINLILAFLIASITFPFRYMLFFVILNNVAIALLPFIYPEFKDVGTVLGLFIPFSLLTLAVMRHRENVEKDRLHEFKQFNEELTTLKDELEQRVEDRTKKLEERSRQMQAVTEVARTAASFQDLDRLLTSSTRLISESFGFYHVGIFLLDEEGQYAILHASNSEEGQRMLARMHTLPVDLNSVVGYTAKTQVPRIALNTDKDDVYFNNPDTPETHSEMAVPLKVGMRLIGVLDVQSTEKDAFSEDDIAIIGTLGDQLAVAIDNTRLLAETRQALLNAEQTYQRYFNQTWSLFSRQLKQKGYRYHDGKILSADNDEPFDIQPNDNGASKLRIPLIVRGQNIGTLDIKSNNENRSWAPGEVAIMEAAAERAALALESARLLEDAQRRAAKEQIIGEVSSRINSAISIDNILQTAIREMGRVLPGAEISIQVESNPRPEKL